MISLITLLSSSAFNALPFPIVSSIVSIHSLIVLKWNASSSSLPPFSSSAVSNETSVSLPIPLPSNDMTACASSEHFSIQAGWIPAIADNKSAAFCSGWIPTILNNKSAAIHRTLTLLSLKATNAPSTTFLPKSPGRFLAIANNKYGAPPRTESLSSLKRTSAPSTTFSFIKSGRIWGIFKNKNKFAAPCLTTGSSSLKATNNVRTSASVASFNGFARMASISSLVTGEEEAAEALRSINAVPSFNLLTTGIVTPERSLTILRRRTRSFSI